MHRDIDIDFPEHDEPTHVPTGDECEHAARGSHCTRTDCPCCSVAAAVFLRAIAARHFRGLLSLAREVARVQEYYGNNIPDGPVVLGDVCAAAKQRAFGDKALSAFGSAAVAAWAEGLVDAVCAAPMPRTERDCFPTRLPERPHWQANIERWCYFLGRVAPALYRLHAHLRNREAQAMADADITSAAVAQQAVQPRSTQGVVTGRSGFESRAQHRR